MYNRIFFKPWVGKRYLEGFNGARILVLGSSHYCNSQSDCKYFEECTSGVDGARRCDCVCPDYKDKRRHNKLSDTTINEITCYLDGEYYNTYHRFTLWMLDNDIENDNNKKELWDRIAFSNIYQYPLAQVLTPQDKIDDIEKLIGDIIDDKSLLDYPDLIIVWGAIVRNNMLKQIRLIPVKNHNRLYRWRDVDGKDITVFFMTHPSAPIFCKLDRSLLGKAISLSKK